MHEQKITLLSFLWRFLKLLLRPGVVGNLRALLAARPEEQRSMVDYLERHAVESPDALALAYQDERLTWSELNARVNQVAHAFQSRGVGYGDRVAINMENRPELVIAALACMKLGAIAGMMNTSQTNDALAHSCALIDPKLLFIGAECWDNMLTISDKLTAFTTAQMLYVSEREIAKDIPAECTDFLAILGEYPLSNPVPDKPLTLGTACYYIFTSGTTGLPKASITTHMKVYRAGMQFGVNVMSLTQRDVYYCPLPFYHSNALVVALGSCLLSGAALAMRRKFSASAFWDDCRAFGATAFIYIGELLRYLIAQPVTRDDHHHQVKKILGNGLRPEIWLAFKARFGIDRIHEFYGASEANTGFVNILNFDKTCGWSPQFGSAWHVLDYDVDHDEVRRNADGYAVGVAPGQVGLLAMKITEQNPFDGYTDQQANEKKIIRDVFEAGDAWFNSGDLVLLQPFGHIQFSDRIGDTFRWQGENVATTQVEGVVIDWPQIETAVVYGVQVPGWDGRCGMLYVNEAANQSLDLDSLARHLADHLPSYAIPRFVRIGRAVDLTGTFKIQKSQLKREGYSADVGADQLFVFDREESLFRPLTAERRTAIDQGQFRL